MTHPSRSRKTSNGTELVLRFITLGLVIAVCSCVSVPQDPMPVSPACSVPEADRAWIDRSLEAWQFASREIAGIGVVPYAQVILFSEDCVLRSEVLRDGDAERVGRCRYRRRIQPRDHAGCGHAPRSVTPGSDRAVRPTPGNGGQPFGEFISACDQPLGSMF